MDHFKVTFEPDNRAISIGAGASVLEAAERAGIILNTTCGGKGTCRKCAVVLGDGQKVLACQHKITSDLVVTIPDTSRLTRQKILDEGIDRKIRINPTILQRDIQFSGDAAFGVAVDLGTTTVVAKLIDLKTGELKGTASMANPQIKFGDDVITRITHGSEEQGLDQLHLTVLKGINQLIEQLCSGANIEAESIFEVTVACNTTMNHLLLKLPVVQLGQAPYEAYTTDAFNKNASEFGLKINPEGNLHTIENIAGFVGSDTVAVALAAGMDTEVKKTLIVDIGTNGELILGTRERMLSASCAAGPAFEGARIEQGSRAVDGAIEAVLVDGEDIAIEVIGGDRARSICGSGLLDAVAVLLDLGVIDITGRFAEPDEFGEKIARRIVTYNDQPAFELADGVLLTQKDVRETQLAKAAIRTGIAILQKELDIPDADIDQILLAGAFGNYIRRESALRIGLLPKVEVEKVKFIGNAVATGAQMDLLNSECRKTSGKLAGEIQYLEIASRLDFQEIFAEAIMFD